jgi:hypothetical protein
MHCWITPNGQKIVAQSFTGLIAKYCWVKLKPKAKKLDSVTQLNSSYNPDVETQMFLGSRIYPLKENRVN